MKVESDQTLTLYQKRWEFIITNIIISILVIRAISCIIVAVYDWKNECIEASTKVTYYKWLLVSGGVWLACLIIYCILFNLFYIFPKFKYLDYAMITLFWPFLLFTYYWYIAGSVSFFTRVHGHCSSNTVIYGFGMFYFVSETLIFAPLTIAIICLFIVGLVRL